MKTTPPLRITIIQTDLFWENPKKNLEMLQNKILGEVEETDLIVLPEMFNTGFTMNSALFAEDPDGPTIDWMRRMAHGKNAVIAGSLIVRENNKYFNRLIWMLPGGDFHYYDKRHLFRMAEEHKHFSPGKERVIMEIHGWKIFPLICYDLRFPVWSRNREDYDVLIYIANWPEKRGHAWRSLLVARAIENTAYVAGVNRVGTDGKDILYAGDSAIIDFRGEYLAATRPLMEEILTMELSYEDLLDFRASFPVQLDSDDFELRDN
jgi:omega-amidase